MQNFWQNLNSPVALAAGLTLLHFLWQGALVAAGLAAAFRLTRRGSANLRYTTACVALMACLVIPFGTFVLIRGQEIGSKNSSTRTVQTDQTVSSRTASNRTPVAETQPAAAPLHAERTGVPPRKSFSRRPRLDPILPWVVCGWLGGVLMLSARLLGGWVFVQHLRSRLIRPVACEWHAALERLAARLRVRRRVWLFESAAVDVALVIGWLRPVILLPAGLMTGLTPAQIETLTLTNSPTSGGTITW
jgi:beta-lactamase regulating signal transducer with metallopeptidase domain